MQQDLDLKQTNDSGFPLQIAIGRAVAETSAVHGWSVRYVEHAYGGAVNGQAGFIDLVLENKYRTAFLVLECKRVKQAKWIFLPANGVAKPRRHAKVWVSKYENDQFSLFGWSDVHIEPETPEGLYCAVQGQSANDKSTLLERVAGELVAATESFAFEERDFRPQYPNVRFYFNVIVTTAELKVAKFKPDDASLLDGTIANAEFESVPFVRFRKQFSPPRALPTPVDYRDDTDLAYQRQNTVFVVRADALTEFLRLFEISSSGFKTSW